MKADSIGYSFGIFGIKNEKSFLISTSSKNSALAVRLRQGYDATLKFSTLENLVGQEELESSTFAVSERHSNQLNY